MKALAKIVLEIVIKYVMSILTEDEINALLNETVTAWCEKHLTAQEIGNELTDFGKIIKKIF